jgi:hypothetical protein
VQSLLENNQLLAVDLGLRCGMALYGHDGRLRWYRSQHFGGVPQLRRAATRTLGPPGQVSWLLSEGDVSLAAIWERVAMRQGVRVQRVNAETWRDSLMVLRQRRATPGGMLQAEELARRVIAWSGVAAPASLTHDAAEAILIGLWGVLTLGWLTEMPSEVGQSNRRLLQVYR